MEKQIIHWDSLQEMDKLIEQWVKVDAIITDPPFNLVEKQWGNIHLFRQSLKHWRDVITEDSMNFDKWFCQISWIEKACKLLKPWGNIVIFNDWENMTDIAKELRKNRINVKSLNHWQKTNPLPNEWRRRFVSGREYFLYWSKKGKTHTFNVDKVHNGCFEMWLTPWREKKHWKHPNQKSIKLMSEIISIVTNKWDTILDCFAWSGSTLVAARNTNRWYIGIELNEEFYNLSLKRINEWFF